MYSVSVKKRFPLIHFLVTELIYAIYAIGEFCSLPCEGLLMCFTLVSRPRLFHSGVPPTPSSLGCPPTSSSLESIITIHCSGVYIDWCVQYLLVFFYVYFIYLIIFNDHINVIKLFQVTTSN